jgi:ketosteroid isomerase-like protein
MAMRAAIPGTTADAASAPAAGSGRDAVLATVAAWAKAWSARDVPAYLAFYASDFEPPAGTPRQAWENQRQVRIANKERIEVTFAQPQVEQRGDSATVQFRQTYRSDRFTAKDRKTLVLVRQDGNWKIKKEWTGK